MKSPEQGEIVSKRPSKGAALLLAGGLALVGCSKGGNNEANFARRLPEHANFSVDDCKRDSTGWAMQLFSMDKGDAKVTYAGLVDHYEDNGNVPILEDGVKITRVKNAIEVTPIHGQTHEYTAAAVVRQEFTTPDGHVVYVGLPRWDRPDDAPRLAVQINCSPTRKSSPMD